MVIMGKAARDAAAWLVYWVRNHEDQASKNERELAEALQRALDTTDTLAEVLKRLATRVPRGGGTSLDAEAEAALTAYDGPGAARVTRGELADAVRLERRYHPKEHERRSDGRCRCNVCTLLDRIAAE